MQLVLVYKLVEEYQLTDELASILPAVVRQVLMKDVGDRAVPEAQVRIYWSATVT